MTTTVTRRTAFAGAAALAAAPALASTRQTTPISRLWAEAERLNGSLAAHRAAIAEAAANGGISGWMRLGGEANRIGSARYERLVAILNAEAETPADLAIIAQVSRDEDILAGPRSFAADKLAHATVRMFAAAA
jgi:hypothetical protein